MSQCNRLRHGCRICSGCLPWCSDLCRYLLPSHLSCCAGAGAGAPPTVNAIDKPGPGNGCTPPGTKHEPQYRVSAPRLTHLAAYCSCCFPARQMQQTVPAPKAALLHVKLPGPESEGSPTVAAWMQLAWRHGQRPFQADGPGFDPLGCLLLSLLHCLFQASHRRAPGALPIGDILSSRGGCLWLHLRQPICRDKTKKRLDAPACCQKNRV